MKMHVCNGKIYSMDNGKIYHGMVIENGIISELGSDTIKQENCESIDLGGKTVLPAFVDAHSHITSVAMAMLQVDLSECRNIGDIQNALADFVAEAGTTPVSSISAVGYDHNALAEKRHPTREELDHAVSDIPVVIIHSSNHFGVFNTRAIEALQLDTQDGYLQETSFVNAVRKMPMPTISEIAACYVKAQTLYASYGITHVQDGMIVKEMLPIYQALTAEDRLFLDVLGYAAIEERDSIQAKLENKNPHVSLPGYKIILDGSPQGKTAWMLTPYQNTDDCAGGLIDDETLRHYFAISIKEKKQLIAHSNGDAACAQFLRIAKEFDSQDIRENRPVIIHAQLLRPDQLDDVKALGIVPSFFVAHVYHFGDIHIENFGKTRAEKISPAQSAQRKGIPFTFHQDSPVIKPDMFETIWCSVARKTKNGIVLGEEEKIDVYAAVEALTLSAAKQYKLDHKIGSLAKGKQANFIVIDQDVFSVQEEDIRNIRVLETYKNGVKVYNRS